MNKLPIRKNSIEYDEIARRIISLYVQHRTYNEIAKQLDLKVAFIRTVVSAHIKKWQEQDIRKIQAYKWAELEKINLIEAEMWEAWNASKGKAKKITMNAVSGNIPRDSQGNILGTDVIPMRKRQEVTEEENFSGDMRYMETIKWCSKRRADLLGLDSPKKFVETDLDGNKSQAEMTRNEILQKLEDLAKGKFQTALPEAVDGEIVEDAIPETHRLNAYVERKNENE